jgi:hypothetical protein
MSSDFLPQLTLKLVESFTTSAQQNGSARPITRAEARTFLGGYQLKATVDLRPVGCQFGWQRRFLLTTSPRTPRLDTPAIRYLALLA